MSDYQNKSDKDERKDKRNQTSDMMNTPEGVLTPGELDVSDEVVEIESGRTVVPTDDSAGSQVQQTQKDEFAYPQADEDTENGPALDSNSAYAVNISVQTPDGIETTLIETDDVRDFFDELLLWQVSQIAPDTNPKEALVTLIRSSPLLD